MPPSRLRFSSLLSSRGSRLPFIRRCPGEQNSFRQDPELLVVASASRYGIGLRIITQAKLRGNTDLIRLFRGMLRKLSAF